MIILEVLTSWVPNNFRYYIYWVPEYFRYYTNWVLLGSGYISISTKHAHIITLH